MPEKGTRQLTAIMFADMVGYTALMQADEEEARAQRDQHRSLISATVERHQGKILQYYGDGTLSIFASAVNAVECAVEIQQGLQRQSIIPLRIGVHTGDIVHDDDGVYGDGVNLAARIEGIAAPGGIAVSAKVFDEIKNHPAISTIPLGSVQLKNVEQPVTLFAISNEGVAIPTEEQIKALGGGLAGPDARAQTAADARPSATPSSTADDFLRQIKDRALVQWALAYLAGGWAFLEIAGFATSQFSWPSLVPMALTLLVIAGFFLTLVLAWYHGERGRQKVSGPELLIIALLLAITGGALAVFAPGGGDLALPGVPGIRLPGSQRPAIAVLPFLNQSAAGDEEAAFLATGLHDDLLTQLSKIASLDVIARTSVMQYAGTGKTILEIGRELGVPTVLEGSVMRAGGRVRLNFQLIDARTNTHLWAETYDRDFTVENVFDIQSDLALQVARQLQAELAPTEAARIEDVPTENLEAYQFFRRGKDAFDRPGWDPADLEIAGNLFSLAVEADPDFALAYASLSHTLCYLFLFYDRSPARLEDARAAADEALRLDPDLARAHLARAFYHYLEYENDEAMEALARAEEGIPGSGELLTLKSEIHLRRWEWDASLAAKERGALLDPLNPEKQLRLAEAYAEYGRWDDAFSLLNRIIRANPDFHEARFSLGWIIWRRTGDGGPTLEALASVPPENSVYGLKDFFRWLVAPTPEDKVAALDGIQEPILEFGGFWWAPRELLVGWTFHELDPARARPAFEQAVEICLEALERHPDDPRIHASLGRAYGYLGRREEAVQEARRVVEILPITKDPGWGRDLLETTAYIYASLGMGEEAAEALETSFSVPGVRAVWALLGPDFSKVRNHPRIQALIDRYGPEAGIDPEEF
jgi:serine/threonine-protein kinase